MSHSYWKEYADMCAETFSGQDEAQQRALDVLDKADRQIDTLRASRAKLAWLLRAARGHNCDHLHHEKKDQHDSMTPCPILSRIDAALAEVGGSTAPRYSTAAEGAK